MACCETLEKVRDAAKENLSGKNLEVFLTEIGTAFLGYASPTLLSSRLLIRVYSLLLEHLKKFPVSATGGLMLAK